MIEDSQLLEAWYRYAASAPDFVGSALRAQRDKAFVTQEQQRNMLGILDGKYDQLWLRIQSMPLPRTDQFTTDMQNIVLHIVREVGIAVTLDIEQLEALIRSGLEQKM